MGFIYTQKGQGLSLQAHDYSAATKSDSTTFAPSSIYVGTAGDVVLMNIAGGTVLFKNCSNGSIIPVLATRIMSTGTTASDFVILS